MGHYVTTLRHSMPLWRYSLASHCGS